MCSYVLCCKNTMAGTTPSRYLKIIQTNKKSTRASWRRISLPLSLSLENVSFCVILWHPSGEMLFCLGLDDPRCKLLSHYVVFIVNQRMHQEILHAQLAQYWCGAFETLAGLRRYAGPKRLMLNQGIHASAEIPGIRVLQKTCETVHARPKMLEAARFDPSSFILASFCPCSFLATRLACVPRTFCEPSCFNFIWRSVWAKESRLDRGQEARLNVWILMKNSLVEQISRCRHSMT